jgi:hypothetical protein
LAVISILGIASLYTMLPAHATAGVISPNPTAFSHQVYGAPTIQAFNTSDRAGFPLHGTALKIFIIAAAVFGVFIDICLWFVFKKAGRHGWQALIPVYNSWVLFEMGGKPGWWSILALIPIVSIVVLVMLVLAYIEIAHRFGKSDLFGVFGLVIFGFIGFPILAFGSARYTAPAASH